MSQQDTTQAKFRKSPKKESEQPQIEENEVRIKGNLGNVKRYVEYACGLLLKEEKPEEENDDNNNNNNNEKEEKEDDVENNDNNNEKDDKPKEDNNDDDNENKDEPKEKKKVTKQFKTIVLKATGRAINKAVTTAEVVKRRVAGLHQDTKLETLEIVDVWEPLEEGLKQVETTRRVASITITLSLDPEEIESMKQNTGYQQPLSADAVKIKTGDYNSRRSNNYRGNTRRGGYRRGNGRRGGVSSYNRNNSSYYYGGSGGYGRRGGYGGSRRGGYNSNYYNGGSSRGGGYGSRYRGSGGYNRNYNRY